MLWASATMTFDATRACAVDSGEGGERKNGSRDVSTNYGSDVTSKLTPDELIRLELRGKFLAVERYDSMLWKIRSGYVVVLYGALTIVGGTSGLTATPSLGGNRVLGAALLLIWGFSLSGLAVDYFFLKAKFRVVNDVNALKDLGLPVHSAPCYSCTLPIVEPLTYALGSALRKTPPSL